MCFLIQPIDAIFRITLCKNFFSRKKRFFFSFHISFLIFFLCTTIKTIISIFLCEEQFFKEHIFLFFQFCSCLSCARPLIRSLGIIYVKTMLHGRIRFFKSSRLVFLSFLCTTIETIFSLVLCENDLLENFFFKFHVLFFHVFLVLAHCYNLWDFLCKKRSFIDFLYFFNFQLFFLASFLCSTTETIFRIVLCQSNSL